MAEWPHLRVEQVRLEAGHLNPVAFQFNEIGFVLSGRTVTSYSGNGLKQQYLIEQGTARVCPAGIVERDVVLDAAIECLFISLPPGLIEQSALDDYDIDPAKAELVYAGGLVDPTLQRIALSFHDVLCRGVEPATDRLFVDGMQAALAAHLLGNYSVDRWRRPERAPQIDLRRLARVLDYVDAHYAENIALSDLAAAACLSPYHFSRLFREATGQSPHQYLTSRRVKAAEDELMRNRAPMAEVAQATGFGSQANFIRVFKKMTGVTPGTFRNGRMRPRAESTASPSPLARQSACFGVDSDAGPWSAQDRNICESFRKIGKYNAACSDVAFKAQSSHGAAAGVDMPRSCESLRMTSAQPIRSGRKLMSEHLEHSNDLEDPKRRAVLRAAGGIALGGVAAVLAANAPASAQEAGTRDPASLGARLRGVQHFGLTVQNMERAYEFYTAVLGGTEIMRDGDFQGERIHNTLLTDQEIEARARNVNPRTMGIPDLRGGTQRLDVRFIQFDNVVIELLQYRDAEQPMGGPHAFAEPLDHMSPAFPRMMHICFHIRDDVDFNQFITDLEAESARRGMTQVRANRVVTVTTEQERLAAPMGANSNGITDGLSNGWRLIYCKGSEGEQIEFVQALGPVKKTFDDALAARQRLVGGT
jgi:AraC-like DNA-binding protein/catechol 2,3-dioxygenase-like lactoylglutathione lyase family enzyme